MSKKVVDNNKNKELEEMDLEGANLLPKPINKQEEIPFCGCMSVRYYQPVHILITSSSSLLLTSLVLVVDSILMWILLMLFQDYIVLYYFVE